MKQCLSGILLLSCGLLTWAQTELRSVTDLNKENPNIMFQATFLSAIPRGNFKNALSDSTFSSRGYSVSVLGKSDKHSPNVHYGIEWTYQGYSIHKRIIEGDEISLSNRFSTLGLVIRYSIKSKRTVRPFVETQVGVGIATTKAFLVDSTSSNSWNRVGKSVDQTIQGGVGIGVDFRLNAKLRIQLKSVTYWTGNINFDSPLENSKEALENSLFHLENGRFTITLLHLGLVKTF